MTVSRVTGNWVSKGDRELVISVSPVQGVEDLYFEIYKVANLDSSNLVVAVSLPDLMAGIAAVLDAKITVERTKIIPETTETVTEVYGG